MITTIRKEKKKKHVEEEERRAKKARVSTVGTFWNNLVTMIFENFYF